jgi:hypothetical protein
MVRARFAFSCSSMSQVSHSAPARRSKKARRGRSRAAQEGGETLDQDSGFSCNTGCRTLAATSSARARSGPAQFKSCLN